ncbi:porin-like protein [Prochlorococcus marinus str. NATL2A]|uniref:Porin-like protein n=1 Tax=Prochlorococcus marinus (strain NATL2A) TaxID=59920 RepID=Q46GZ3_PROMT|nr:porin [Prochlorococcus marinus]AAZ59245.1 porin-like protein [Prochlorococcus marinus str. NATL2A]
MKLFSRLLVAPAALGLMAPVAANADTAFSSTTTLSGSAVFTTGSVADGGTADNQEELYMQYAYGLDLNSSFTGEDLFSAGLVAGNASGPLASMDSAESGDLTVTSLFYNFPVGDLSVTVGPLVDQDDVVAATTSAYSDAFRLGSMPYSLAGNETGPGVGVAYSNDNGVVASVSFVSVGGSDSTVGIGADDGDDVSTFTLGYNGDGFGGGLVIASNDGEAGEGYDTFGGGIYYSPESIDATFSVAYDTTDPETGADATDLFIGVDYEVGPGTLSAAYNETDVDGGSSDDVTGFEVSYTYAINDSVTITPGFFTVEDNTGDDDSGVVLETVFSF